MAYSKEELASLADQFPDSFAYKASGGRWYPYKWLQHVSRLITPSLHEGGGRFLVEAPPQHGKSEFLSHWTPAWFLKKYQERKVILASYGGEYASKFGVKVRDELLYNPHCAVPLRIDSKTKKRFVTSSGGQMLLAGVGGTVTGEGADLLLIDDPYRNWEEAMSPRIREKVLDWYKSVARTRLQTGATIIIMHTRWHEQDLIGTLASEPGWTKIRLPALAEEDDPLGRAVGEALCPERFDQENLETTKKEVGEMIWEALYQQNPVAKGGNIIHGDWIKHYTTLPQMDEIAIFADLTYKEGQDSDYTDVEAWGRKGPDIYLISQIRAQMGFSDQIEAIARMITLYPKAFHKEIEEAANGAAVIETLKQHVPGIQAVKPKTSKEARLHAVSPVYRSGNVWYPDPSIAPWIKTNITEITKFPRWKNDDTVDVATMAVSYFGRFHSSLQRLAALAKR
jgi:predicted phage terminase large subunit-like protein